MAEFEDLKAGAERIRDEVTDFANSATRIGNWNLGILNWVKNYVNSIATKIVQTVSNKTDEVISTAGLKTELDKKADETKTVSGVTYTVVRTLGGVIPPVDLTPYAKTTTPEGIVVRSVDGKIPTVDISGKVDKTTIYNVSQVTGNYAYTDKTTARNAVTANLRARTQLITYSLVGNVIVNEQYIGTDIAGWSTESNWKNLGEVTKADLALKADKILADNSPVTYFKTASGGSSTDLTATLRANIVGGYVDQSQWLISPTGSTSLKVVKSATPADTSVRAVTTIKLEANTWYDIEGLPNPMSQLTNLPSNVNDRNTMIKAAFPASQGNMPPVAALYAGTTSIGNSAEFIYAPYNSAVRFKTGTTNLWLAFTVKMDGAYYLDRYQTTSIHYPMAEFDARDSVTLKKVSVNETSGRLFIDSQGTQILDFDTEINTVVSSINGISMSEASGGRVNLLPEAPKLNANIFILKDGTYANLGGNGTTGYMADFITVEPNKVYALGFAIASNDAANYRGLNCYNSNKEIIEPIDLVIQGGFITPPTCVFVRFNVWISSGKLQGADPFVRLAFPESSSNTPSLRVAISSSSLIDAVTHNDGIILPKLYISSDNIVDGAGGGGGTTGEFHINMRNINTFVGSFNTALDLIFAKKNKAFHVFIGHFTSDGSAGNGALQKLIATQKAVCKNRNIMFIDLNAVLGLTNNDNNVINSVDYNNLKKWTSDGLHPGVDDGTQAFANTLTRIITEALRPIFSTDWSGKIVANIGDSISAGYSWNNSTVTWARFIYRAIVALGGTPKLYAKTGGSLRSTTTDNRALSGFMDQTTASWNIKTDVLDKIGTADEPALYVWQLGVNDFAADPQDFKLIW